MKIVSNNRRVSDSISCMLYICVIEKKAKRSWGFERAAKPIPRLLHKLSPSTFYLKGFVIKSTVSWARWSKHKHPGLVEQYFNDVNPKVIQSKVLNTVSRIDSMKSGKSRRCSCVTN